MSINYRNIFHDNDYSLGISISSFFCFFAYLDVGFAIPIVISLQIYTLLRFLNCLGKNIPFLEFLAFYSVLDTLLMPVFGYMIYNEQHELATTWGRFMRVPSDVYFGYMIPANVIFISGMSIYAKTNSPENITYLIHKMKDYLKSRGDIGIAFIIIGYGAEILKPLFPSQFAHIIGLVTWLRLIGPIYLYYSNHPFRQTLTSISLIIILLDAIKQGMFGSVVMYFGLLGLIIFTEFRLYYLFKVFILSFALFLVLLVQSVKWPYREITWKGLEREGLSLNNGLSSSIIFYRLILNRIKYPEKIFTDEALFTTFVRMNQGYLISVAMNYVPKVEPYAYGSTLVRTIGGILLPRFVWPNKPESGGVENMRRFMGIKGKITYSMNIGPFGEAYGNFGPFFGLVIVFIFGFLLSYLLFFCLKVAHIFPSLLAWFPVLFFYTLTVETDILSTLNSLVKSGVFIYFLYRIGPILFGKNL